MGLEDFKIQFQKLMDEFISSHTFSRIDVEKAAREQLGVEETDFCGGCDMCGDFE